MTTQKNGRGRPRGSKNRSVTERLEALRAEFAAKEALLLAKASGEDTLSALSDVDAPTSLIAKMLESAIKKREKAILNARRLIDGQEAHTTKRGREVGRIAPIEEKIEAAERRLAMLRDNEGTAMGDLDIFPGEVETLKDLLERANNGEEVSIPEGLRQVRKDRSQAEVEAASPLTDDDE